MCARKQDEERCTPCPAWVHRSPAMIPPFGGLPGRIIPRRDRPRASEKIAKLSNGNVVICGNFFTRRRLLAANSQDSESGASRPDGVSRTDADI